MGMYLAYWDRLGGAPPGTPGLEAFFRSEHYRDLPLPDCTASLAALLMTSREPIQKGDSMDVGCAGAVLPYCNVVLTDRKMRNRLRYLRLDLKYGSRVLSLEDHDEIIKSLGELT